MSTLQKLEKGERKMCDNEVKKEVVVEEVFCNEEEIELTVHKTSMFSHGDGFIVYDSKGDIVFRVDSYTPILKNRLLLMDTFGKPLLTLLPKVIPLLINHICSFINSSFSCSDQTVSYLLNCFVVLNSMQLGGYDIRNMTCDFIAK